MRAFLIKKVKINNIAIIFHIDKGAYKVCIKGYEENYPIFTYGRTNLRDCGYVY